MRLTLKPHSSSPPLAAIRIEAEASRGLGGRLELRYRALGAVDALLIPPPSEPARTDGLWERTCFEAFVQAGRDEAYHEFNFAPSGRWAAYRFEGYRSGMEDADVPAPSVVGRAGPDEYGLDVSLELERIADLAADATWRIGLSAVIEEKGGRKSWWALAHPPGKADFHHPHSLMLELPSP